MDDNESGTSQDDLSVEITDLDPSPGASRPLWPRLTRSQRRLSLAATFVLFVLIMGLLLSSVSDIRALLGRVFPVPPASPGPSIEAGPFLVYLRGNPAWGHFTLDGKALARLPVIGQDQPLQLAHGTHTIIWQAEPFRPKVCHFTVIDALTLNGPCFVDSTTTPSTKLVGVAVKVIAFFASLSDLPVEQRVSLSRQIQEQFTNVTSSMPVQTGELYAVSEQEAQADPALCRPFEGLALCYARAQQPLVATLNLQVDNSTASDDPCILSGPCNINAQDCRMLCEDPILDYGPPQIEGWSVTAVVRLLWSYRTLAGQTIASDQPDSALRGSQLYQEVSLHIQRDGRGNWHVDLFPRYTPPDFLSNSPICTQASSDTMSALNASFDNNANMYVTQAATDPAHMAAGCLTLAQQPLDQVGATPTPTRAALSPATFLLSFGVLLAVNASARKICPDLPFADAEETRLAQHLQDSFSTSA
jgi:hypothetical protein